MQRTPDDWMRDVARTFDVRPGFDDRALFLTGVTIKGGCWHRRLRRFDFRGMRVDGQRLAYAMFVGPVYSGQTVASTCGNEQCCRPDHLELITVKHAKKTVKPMGASA